MKKKFTIALNLIIYSIVSFTKVNFHFHFVDIKLTLIVIYDVLTMFLPLICIGLVLRKEYIIKDNINHYAKLFALICFFIFLRKPLFEILFQNTYRLPFTISMAIIISIIIAYVKLKTYSKAKQNL